MNGFLCGFVVGYADISPWFRVFAYDDDGNEWIFNVEYGQEQTAELVADKFRSGELVVDWADWDSMSIL